MSQYRKQIRHDETLDNEQIDFESVDSKGRVIGVSIVTYESDFVPSEYPGGYLIAEGHYFSINVQTTRDGQRFGACQNHKHFATALQRAVWLDKRIAQAEKRARKVAS